MKFGIITDPHLGPNSILDGTVRIWGEKASENLSAALETLRSESPEFIVQLGDAIDESKSGEAAVDRARFREIADLFKRLDIPAYHVLGNHDVVNLPEEQVAKLLGMPASHYSFNAGEYLGVALFCPSQNHLNATLPARQLEWLEKELGKTKKEALVFIHHPLAEHSLDHTFWFKGKPEKAFVRNRNEVIEVLAASGKVRGVFNGHLHASNFTTIKNIPFFTIQSISQSVEPSLAPAQTFAAVTVTADDIAVSILGNEPRSYLAPR